MLPDLKRSEIALAGVLVIFIFWGGLAPNTFLKPMQASVDAMILMADAKAGKRPQWSEAVPEKEEAQLDNKSAPRFAMVAPRRGVIR